MDWSLLAGGLSKGLEGGLAGANTGLLQGEQIRHQRAQEGLQQQHFGLQQQQLERALRQQDINNQFMQQRLGMQGRTLDLATQRALAEQAYREAQLGNLQSRTRLQEERLPFQIEKDKAYTEWMRRRPSTGAGSSGWEAQYKNGLAMRMGFDSYLDAPPETRYQIDQEFSKSGRGYDIKAGNLAERQRMDEERLIRMRILNEHTQKLTEKLQIEISNPNLSGSERATMAVDIAKLRNYQSAMNRIQRNTVMQIPPDPKDLAYVNSTDINALEQNLVNLQNRVAERGFTQGNPGQMPPQAQPRPVAPEGAAAVRNKWKLQ